MPIKTVLLGVLPPIFAALIALLAAWRPWSQSAPGGKRGVIGSALALAAAYAITDTLVAAHWPGLPPSERHRWLPYAGLASAAGAILWPPRGNSRWALHDAVALGVFVLLSWRQLTVKGTTSIYVPMFGPQEVPAAVVPCLWILAALAMSNAFRSDAVRVGKCGPRVPLTWLVAAVGAAVVYVQSSEIIFGQMAGVLAAVMAVFVVLALWRQRLELVPGVAPVFAVLYTGLMLCSHTTVVSAVLVMLAAACPALAGTVVTARLRPWVATGLCMLAAAALSIAAVWQSPDGFDFSGF